MKRILAASLVSCLAFAARAGAGDRCDLDGLPGAEVLVRYLLPHPDAPQDPDRHTNDHIPWEFAAGPVAHPGAPISTDDPRVIGVGDFIPGGGCDLLWEEAEPSLVQDVPIRVAVTVGLTSAGPTHFASGVARPLLPWQVGGVLDMTNDGRADVLWWNPGTGALMLWVRTANGWTQAAVIGALPPSDDADTTALATAIVRFEDDQPPGLVWHPGPNAPAYRYFRTSWNGHYLKLEDAGIVQGLDGTGSTLAAVGDFNDDGKDDLLLQRVADLNLIVCYMDGLTVGLCARLNPPTLEIAGSDYTAWVVAGPR